MKSINVCKEQWSYYLQWLGNILVFWFENSSQHWVSACDCSWNSEDELWIKEWKIELILKQFGLKGFSSFVFYEDFYVVVGGRYWVGFPMRGEAGGTWGRNGMIWQPVLSVRFQRCSHWESWQDKLYIKTEIKFITSLRQLSDDNNVEGRSSDLTISTISSFIK